MIESDLQVAGIDLDTVVIEPLADYFIKNKSGRMNYVKMSISMLKIIIVSLSLGILRIVLAII